MNTATGWLSEGSHAGAFIVSEASSGATGVSRSREQCSYSGAEALQAGQVVVVDLAAKTVVAYLNGTSGDANGVLFDNTPAGDVDTRQCVVIVRDAEVNAAELIFDDAEVAGGIASATTELATVGIIARESV